MKHLDDCSKAVRVRPATAGVLRNGSSNFLRSQVVLVVASGSRDPERFPDPERFIPDRTNNQHLGFGSGIHYCFGAPLARLEAQIALTEIASRLANPRLVVDPPPYRPNAALRGPLHLLVEIDGVRASARERPGPAGPGESAGAALVATDSEGAPAP